jgi:polyisoprenoid-binding protein YceI
VSGTLEIDGTQLTDASVEADFTQLVSDISRRDNAMKRAMGVEEFPTGTFTLTEPIDFGEVPDEGATTTFTAVGDLTVNGITHPAEVQMEASLADGNILVVGRAPVVFARYFISAPKAGPVVSIADEGTIEMQLWFTRA